MLKIVYMDILITKGSNKKKQEKVGLCPVTGGGHCRSHFLSEISHPFLELMYNT